MRVSLCNKTLSQHYVDNIDCFISINNYIFFLCHIGDAVGIVNIAGISAGFAVVSSAVLLFILMTVCAYQKKKKGKTTIFTAFVSEIASSSQWGVLHFIYQCNIAYYLN